MTFKFYGAGATFTKSGGTLASANMNFTVPSGAMLTLNNDISVASSDCAFQVENGGKLNCGTSIVSSSGAFNLLSGGTLMIGSPQGITSSGSSGNIQTTTRSFNTNALYTYNGSSAQVTGNGLPSSVNTLTISNANGVTLSNNATVTSTLLFTNGLLTTGSNKVIIGSLGNISSAGSGKYVNGNLQRAIPAGVSTTTYDVGDATNYTPAVLSFAAGTTAGNLTIKSIGDTHPELSLSHISTTKYAKRYWSFVNSGVSGTYDAVYNFVSSDIQGGANPLNFIVGKHVTAGTWIYPAVGTKTLIRYSGVRNE